MQIGTFMFLINELWSATVLQMHRKIYIRFRFILILVALIIIIADFLYCFVLSVFVRFVPPYNLEH
jgi:hypothetical protein